MGFRWALYAIIGCAVAAAVIIGIIAVKYFKDKK